MSSEELPALENINESLTHQFLAFSRNKLNKRRGMLVELTIPKTQECHEKLVEIVDYITASNSDKSTFEEEEGHIGEGNCYNTVMTIGEVLINSDIPEVRFYQSITEYHKLKERIVNYLERGINVYIIGYVYGAVADAFARNAFNCLSKKIQEANRLFFTVAMGLPYPDLIFMLTDELTSLERSFKNETRYLKSTPEDPDILFAKNFQESYMYQFEDYKHKMSRYMDNVKGVYIFSNGLNFSMGMVFNSERMDSQRKPIIYF